MVAALIPRVYGGRKSYKGIIEPPKRTFSKPDREAYNPIERYVPLGSPLYNRLIQLMVDRSVHPDYKLALSTFELLEPRRKKQAFIFLRDWLEGKNIAEAAISSGLALARDFTVEPRSEKFRELHQSTVNRLAEKYIDIAETLLEEEELERLMSNLTINERRYGPELNNNLLQ